MVKLATMATTKSKYKIIEEGGKEYVLASQVSDYAKERLHTSFGVPSYRTIRYYVTNGVLERPLKRGKETYFDTNYIVNAIGLMNKLQPLSPSITDIKGIVPNVTKYGEWKEAYGILESDLRVKYIRNEERKELFHLLATKRPHNIILGRVGRGKTHLLENISFKLYK